ncbi:UNVERIFIED_CONTAM: hypothetical protein GTU68_062784 [Idotea baltica]|nr:hypothetical protein [Idotea baltica]
MIPTPKNLNWMWIWGIVLTFCLALQIITGIILVMHYVPHVDMAFDSVEHIMRDVNGGWAFRYLHANGASLFFIAVYIHIFRGLYYGSYKSPREITWIVGMLIYLAMMATGFLGYVLPWGQMSFWGATVITGLFGAIPGVGPIIQEWLLGGPAVDQATLNRFFSLHYLLPFVIVGLVVLHIWAFHTTGNNNPTGVEAILRAITFDVLFLDAKFLGVLAMFGAIFVMALAPWLDTSSTRSGRYRPMFKWWFWLLGVDFMVLMWCGARPAEGLVPTISLIGAIYWFAYFLVILPILGRIEKPLPTPETIEADFDAHYPPKSPVSR